MKKVTMTKQNLAVLNHIKKYGFITTAAAFSELGITRLPARIYDLKRLGYVFACETKSRRLEDGSVTRWKEYRLAA